MNPTGGQTAFPTQPTAQQLATTGGKAVEGAWYGGQRYMGGQLLAPGQDQAGHDVSADVIAQTNPNNVAFVNQQRAAGGLGATPGSPLSTTPNGSGQTATTSPTNPDIETSKAKIATYQQQISDRQKAAADAITNINDNPFYSESSRVGKIDKVNQDLNADLAPLTQQLQSEQANYDALVKAATPNTEVVQSTDDAGNLTLLTVNKDTGAVISQQTMPGVGKGKSSSSFDKTQAISEMNALLHKHANSYGNVSPADWNQALQEWLNAGGDKQTFIDNFGNYADTNRGDFETSYGFKNPNPTWAGSTYVGKDKNAHPSA